MSDIDQEEAGVADLPLWADSEANLRLSAVCEKHNVPIDVLTELVSLQRERQHQERAHGIFMRFEEILGRMD
ncbi:DNA modification system-associated small protein [Bordetella trematum]|uniref:DNA modification system-associated small protein n=1 Tax=Bordetella trematum TaxID=123899 RepID=UPI0012FFE959|nr:DNA modification system-associated small protein [Bordetella trematum]